MNRFCFDSSEAQIAALSERLVADLAGALSRHAEVVLAVSGGRSPLPLFRRLAQNTSLDWSRIIVSLVDERVVAESHPDSNAALVKAALLQGAAAAARFLPLVRDGESPDEAVRHSLAQYRQPHLVVLGMGEDGHTASLFPDAPELPAGLASDAPALIATTPGSAPHCRVSMTLASLGRAENLYLSIQGGQKRAVLDAALAHPSAALPIGLVLTLPGVVADVYEC